MDNQYDPEIEARRGEYERLAEGLAHMINLHGGPRDRLDLEGFEARSKNHLINGIDEHLYALWENMDWHDVNTLRKFYAEMRLHADQVKLEYERARREFATAAEAAG